MREPSPGPFLDSKAFDQSRFKSSGSRSVLSIYCLVKVGSECSTFINLQRVGKIGEILYFLSENSHINEHKKIEYSHESPRRSNC